MKRGYETPPPEEIETTAIKCFRVFIPDHPDYRQAFLGALHGFTTWGVWKRTNDQRAKLSADLWKTAMEMTMNECGDIDLTEIETTLSGLVSIQASLANTLTQIRECICRIATATENPPAPYPEVPEPPTPEEPPIFEPGPPSAPISVTDCQRNIFLARVVQGKLTRIAGIMSASFPLNWVGIFQELKAAEGQSTLIYRFTMLVIGAFAGVAVLVFSLLGWGVGATLNAWAELFDDYIFSCKVYKDGLPGDYATFASVVNSMESLSDLGKMFVKVLVWQEALDDIYANQAFDEDGNIYTGIVHLMPNDCPDCPEESGWKGTTVSCPDGLVYWTSDSPTRTYQDGIACNGSGAIGIASGIFGSVISPHQAISMNFELTLGVYQFAYRYGEGSGFNIFEVIDATTNTVIFSSAMTKDNTEIQYLEIDIPATALYRVRVVAVRFFECFDWSWTT